MHEQLTAPLVTSNKRERDNNQEIRHEAQQGAKSHSLLGTREQIRGKAQSNERDEPKLPKKPSPLKLCD
jgi:hypothetical protein